MAQVPKSEREYDKPVAWLVGRDLLGGIKGMLLYTAYGSKLDPRDWMTGKVEPFKPPPDGKEEFWFDFLADAGDGTKAQYAIAYLAMSDLWGKAASEPLSPDGKQELAFENGPKRIALPRGEFLAIGGDTAYHVADLLTLANRIQRPFSYAYVDLSEHVKIKQSPIFGIPGNHDYYDQLDGFRRQFRKPVRPEPPQPPENPGRKDAQLGIAGYYRQQEASYFALKLPFDWWVWGLDTETGPLDRRQRKFFASLRTDEQDQAFIQDEDGRLIPKKLIAVTCSPTTVFGKVADEKDFKAVKALQRLLGPKQPFLPPKKNGAFVFDQAGDAALKEGQCRLDLAGDVHHYARYWGPEPKKPAPARERSNAPTPTAKSYASVVSGLGGAFHHPSNTYDDQLQEQVLYPSEKVSREAVGKEVFNFWSIRKGGYVWLFGFIIAFVIYFALSVTQSSRQDISNLGPLRWAHMNLVQQELIRPTTGAAHRDYFFITSIETWPHDLWLGTALILLAVVAAIVSFFLRQRLFGPKDIDPRQSAPPPNPFWKILWFAAPTGAAVFLGMMIVQRYRDQVTPFVSSLLVLFTLIVAISAIVLTVHYNQYLFIKGHFDYITRWDRFWPWVLPILSVLVFGVGLWSFGRNNLPALLITDITFTLVVLAVFFGLLVLPFTASGELFFTHSRPAGFLGKATIGLWHASLQLFLPFALIRKGTWLTWVLAALLLVVPIWPASKLFQKNRRGWLLILWFGYGLLMLVLPWLTSQPSRISLFNGQSPFADSSWFGAWGLVPSFFAGLAGAAMSCLWFGWYLGVCSAFNGHNNEVGGAARIEQFKEFMRIKITPTELTAYVIAVDDVSIIGEPDGHGGFKDGRDLRPKLVDMFTLKVK